MDKQRATAVHGPATGRAFPHPKKRRPPRLGQRVILLVEDDDELRRLLARVLRNDGHRVVEAANGDDALDWLGPWALEGSLEFAPDLIVSDIRLPYFTGLEILEGIRIAADEVPVILITGFPDEDTIARGLALGALCVIEKPFELGEFRAAVRSALVGAV